MPLDPTSAQAKAFYTEWTALLAPFTALATPAMMAGVGQMYDRMGEWQGQQKPAFSPAVWAFIKSVGSAPRRRRVDLAGFNDSRRDTFATPRLPVPRGKKCRPV